ncbi:hypothetical protein PHAVU_009G191700 [Phaseolus vulgaris]|uniref:Myb/SANT-like domain-containing protein n=1 Tax=Phaseolus vulgaris TaxID=3885 RepID=V7AXD7_PHAVU|nr:hypothetical protein PHAVU_009G191700g [Phaseolus vulgaris]ESW10229.1 hypothetical protein PHAVU_009G191700g [Phaseolus vulgaris]
MDRGKNVAPNSSGGYREFTKWTTEMNLILLNAIIKKDKWKKLHDLFGGLSGFAWNQTTKHFEAEDEVWSDLIKVKPFATKWRVNPLRHYNLMEDLWSNDRATGNRVRIARDINSPPDISNFNVNLDDNNMDYILEQPNFEEADDYVPRKRHITRKGKAPTEDHVVRPPPTTEIEEVLDYSRYFTTKWQMMMFENMFHGRPVLSPKAMHSPFFATPGFEFQNLLNFQLFYTNLKITPLGDLAIEICGKRIHINQLDWMNIVDLRYDDVKLTPGTIPEECNYDLALALSSTIREDVQGQNVKNAGSLKMNNRLLHYT